MSQEEILTPEQAEEFVGLEELIDKLQLSGDYAAFISNDQAPVSEEFRARTRNEKEEEDTLSVLRAERGRLGFVALSIGEYILGIASAKNLSLASILSRFEISDICRPDLRSAEGLARLGLQLGIGQVEMITHIRIAFAGFTGVMLNLFLLARARDGKSGRLTIEECISILNRIETEYQPAMREELHLIKEAIDGVYNRLQS